MLRFISQTNLCIRKFLDLKRCNSLKSRHRSEILFFQLFEQAFFRRAKARRARREAWLSLTQISCRLRRQEIWVQGYLPFPWENRELRLVRAIWLGELQKTWAMICGNAIFLIFQAFQLIWIFYLAVRSPTSSNFIVMHKISTRVFCVMVSTLA